ncbi:hypothetical protein A8924_7024 [Saccharopolyspora erythraea NRRL 2338]|nr:hypothetical protein A8924_7024 [Saccharopolyspora erythraea NRRL 2338]
MRTPRCGRGAGARRFGNGGVLFAAGGAVSSQCLPFRLGEPEHAGRTGFRAGRGTGVVIRP